MLKQRDKILILENSVAFTGALKSISSVVGVLQDTYDFIIATPNKGMVEQHVSSAKVIEIKFYEVKKDLSLLYYIPVLFINTWRVSRLCKKEGISVVHVNDLYNLVGVLLKLFLPRVKIVYHVRLLSSSYASRLYTAWAYLILKFADVIVCVSQAVYDNLPSSEKKVLIYDAISMEEAHPQKIINTTGTLKILYLANYVAGKGQHLMLEVFRTIHKSDKNIQLIFAGHTFHYKKNVVYKDELEIYVQQHNLQDYVIFKNFVTDVEKEIKDADLVLNFSRSESFSMVCLEALVYGTPIFALNSGGPAELIISQETGILFEKDSSVQFISRAILNVIRNFEIMQRFSTNGKLYAVKHFSIQKSAQEIQNIYQNLLD